jgi:hypothetical protein
MGYCPISQSLIPNLQSPVLVKNDLPVLIDSDIILPLENWLERMVEPFQNAEL